MMKKSLILAGSFVAALLLVAGVLMVRQQKAQPGGQFRVKDTERIRRIVFVRDTTRLELRKKDGVWWANDAWKARPRAMKVLLKVLGETEVRSPLSGELPQRVQEDTASIHTEVAVYGRLLPKKRFEVYLNKKIPGGNMMRLHGKKKWYITELPGEDVNPAALFVTDPYYWRDLRLFHFRPGEVTGVEIRYGKNEGFRAGIDTVTGRVTFVPFDPSLAGMPVDSGKVRRFLTYFQDLSADVWEHLPEREADSILKENSLYEIRIDAAGGKEFRMLVFPVLKKDSITGAGEVDPDVARAWVDPPGEMVLIKYYRIDPFLLKAKEFVLRGRE